MPARVQRAPRSRCGSSLGSGRHRWSSLSLPCSTSHTAAAVNGLLTLAMRKTRQAVPAPAFRIGMAETAGVDQASVIGHRQGGARRLCLRMKAAIRSTIRGQFRDGDARGLAE